MVELTELEQSEALREHVNSKQGLEGRGPLDFLGTCVL